MAEIESEGKTVGEAVENALKKAGLRRDQVEVQVLDEGAAGILGWGARPSRVKITEKHWSPEGQGPAPARPAAGARKKEAGNAAPRPVTPSLRPAPSTPRTPASAPRASESSSSASRRTSGRSQRPIRGSRAAVWGGRKERTPDAPPSGTPQSPQAPQRSQEPRRESPRREPARRETPARAERPAPRPEERPRRPEPAAPLTAEQADAAKLAAVAALQELLPLMKFADAQIRADWDPQLERVKATVETADSSRLIGREGRTLEALQFLVTLLLTRRLENPVAVWVETAGYWERREKIILEAARQGIEQVRSTGKPFRLEPMDPAMRRLIHRSLAGDPDIMTASEGEGSWRKIVIRPKK